MMQSQPQVVPAEKLYLLPIPHQRVFPSHGYTMGMLARKRFYENTSFLFINARFTLPVLVQINQELENAVSQGTDFTMEDFVNVAKGSLTTHTVSLIDWMARIGLQTGIVCGLIASKAAYADSAVYLWDLYPRLHRYYIGKVTSFLKIPRFVLSLLGPCPTPTEIRFMKDRSTQPLCVFEDCLKRHGIILVSDVVVDAFRIMLHVSQLKDSNQNNDNNSNNNTISISTASAAEAAKKNNAANNKSIHNSTPIHSTAVSHHNSLTKMSRWSTFMKLWGQSVLRRCNSTCCAAAGAAVGRAVLNDDGEYWGEIVGLSLSSTVFVLMAANVARLRSVAQRSSRAKHIKRPEKNTTTITKTAASAPVDVSITDATKASDRPHSHRRHSHHRSSSGHSRGSQHDGSKEELKTLHQDNKDDKVAANVTSNTNVDTSRNVTSQSSHRRHRSSSSGDNSEKRKKSSSSNSGSTSNNKKSTEVKEDVSATSATTSMANSSQDISTSHANSSRNDEKKVTVAV